ncbi:chlorosome envelope protein B [Prosthecochloris sp. ZM]|uniref:chlorosome envelope protein B n=1 Tax=unclassified Prosthecochloris TaxID=2632826 RepID=UPI000DF72F83|nr:MULTISPECIES: chlorosome envelope protein B [unclassified Prosthecochloris]NEX13060.1 chlorosome envelope protein B [Prosthecochloris sp.]RDD31056.1 chlorosome envelope protein B [Prosthecochloris sp. ZM]
MANGSNNDLAGAISSLFDTFGKLGQQQVEMLNSGIKTASEMIEPLGKTMTDLAGNLANTVNQVLQNVSSTISGGSAK